GRCSGGKGGERDAEQNFPHPWLLPWAFCAEDHIRWMSGIAVRSMIAERVVGLRALMRHQDREVGVLHDVAGGAAENHLTQAVARESALDQEIAAFRLGRLG